MWKLVPILILALAAGSSLAAALPAYLRADRRLSLAVSALAQSRPASSRAAPELLHVLSLNLAHGRADGAHQLLQGPRERGRALRRIADLLARERPDVVALQEADGPSFWSGGFDHVELLQRLAEFPYAAHGEHVVGPLLRYGTGLLSAARLRDPLSFTFDPSPPTFAKGFCVGTVEVAGEWIDVVSVHLDFASPQVRLRQIATMRDALSGRGRPLVVMGDFNAQWHDASSAVRQLAQELSLDVYEPEAPAATPGVYTYPGSQARLDWILVSPELTFERYAVLPDVVSDHLAVVADIRVR